MNSQVLGEFAAWTFGVDERMEVYHEGPLAFPSEWLQSVRIPRDANGLRNQVLS